MAKVLLHKGRRHILNAWEVRPSDMFRKTIILCVAAGGFLALSGLTLRTSEKVKAGQLQEVDAMQVPEEIKNNCYICHNPSSPSHDAILAPPLAVVKMRYLRQYKTRDEFVNNMVSFLQKPTKQKAIMYGAVTRYGLMPATVFDEATTKKIVEYIYKEKLDEPVWLGQELRRAP